MPQLSRSEDKLKWIEQQLYVPAICDALDSIGYRSQALHQRMRPLDPDSCTFAGRARTVRWMEIDYVVEDDPYGLEIELMDQLQPGDVIVHSADPLGTNAPWGELMSTVAKVRGAVGCVCDSNVRDCKKIMEMNFPVFCNGIRPLDSMGRGRVIEYDVPIRCADVLVKPGELVFADYDGVVIIPLEVEDEVLVIAEEKVNSESLSRSDLKKGRLLRDVYDQYRVL